MTDQATRDAATALAWRIRNRPPDEDPEVTAMKFMLSLRIRGWRQLDTLTSAPDNPPPTDPTDDYRAAKAALTRHPEAT